MSEDLRLTKRLIKYWEMIRKDETLPAYQRLNSQSIHDLWLQSMVVESFPSHEKSFLQFLHVGEKLEDLLGKDMVGKEVSPATMQAIARGKLAKRLEEIVASPQAVEDDGKFVNQRSKVVKYRACFLPFGTDEGHITHVLTGFSWREF